MSKANGITSLFKFVLSPIFAWDSESHSDLASLLRQKPVQYSICPPLAHTFNQNPIMVETVSSITLMYLLFLCHYLLLDYYKDEETEKKQTHNHTNVSFGFALYLWLTLERSNMFTIFTFPGRRDISSSFQMVCATNILSLLSKSSGHHIVPVFPLKLSCHILIQFLLIHLQGYSWWPKVLPPCSNNYEHYIIISIKTYI